MQGGPQLCLHSHTCLLPPHMHYIDCWCDKGGPQAPWPALPQMPPPTMCIFQLIVEHVNVYVYMHPGATCCMHMHTTHFFKKHTPLHMLQDLFKSC